MDIGSAKPTAQEMGDVPHHLIDFLDPKEAYSVSDFQKDAFEKIDDILSRGKLPIVVGGTGLYLNALLFKMDFSETVGDPEFREEMRRQAWKRVQSMYTACSKTLIPKRLKESTTTI